MSSIEIEEGSIEIPEGIKENYFFAWHCKFKSSSNPTIFKAFQHKTKTYFALKDNEGNLGIIIEDQKSPLWFKILNTEEIRKMIEKLEQQVTETEALLSFLYDITMSEKIKRAKTVVLKPIPINSQDEQENKQTNNKEKRKRKKRRRRSIDYGKLAEEKIKHEKNKEEQRKQRLLDFYVKQLLKKSKRV